MKLSSLPRRPLVLVALSIALVLLHAVLVRVMAQGDVAHVLLGAGNGMPPIGAAIVAALFVVVRVVAVVVVPGVILASIAELLAHVVVGPASCRPHADVGP